MITLPNIEGKIWNLEYKVNEIWQELISNREVIISLNDEGPCAQGLGLYALLDDLCDRAKIPRSNIKIITSNQLEHHDYYIVEKRAPLYIEETQKFYRQNKQHLRDKTFNKDFKHFSLLVGRSNWVRLWLAGQVYHQHRDKLLLSFHWSPKNAFQIEHLGLDEMLKWNADLDDIQQATRLLKDCPIIVDAVDSYPVLSPQHLSVCRVYDSFFAEIVCETYFNANSFYPTEKIWRALVTRTPFIVHGPVNFLMNLRRTGFRTFDRWWDESYDDYGHDLRIQHILALIDELSKKSIAEIKIMHNDMQADLDYNFQRFMQLTPLDFQKVFHE